MDIITTAAIVCVDKWLVTMHKFYQSYVKEATISLSLLSDKNNDLSCNTAGYIFSLVTD